jgi:hypothetical protein
MARDEILERVTERLKEVHKMALTLNEDELLATLAMYRNRQFSGRMLTFEEAALVHLIRAVQKVRNCLPIEPGDSPFNYRK